MPTAESLLADERVVRVTVTKLPTGEHVVGVSVRRLPIPRTMSFSGEAPGVYAEAAAWLEGLPHAVGL